MDIKKILVIFLLIVIYSILFWPTLNIYTHTYSNILVKINRITGEAYYFPGDKWRKINYEKISTKESTFKPIDKPMELETKTYSGGVKKLEEGQKVYESGFKPLEPETKTEYGGGFEPISKDGPTK